MKVLYCRVSTIDQQTDRQRVNETDYKLVIEDKCSGSIPFFERQGGQDIRVLIDNNRLTELHVWSIDRLGRNLMDILQTIKVFNDRLIPIHFVSQGLITIVEGKENSIAKLIIGILSVVSEMELNQIRERQIQGVKLAKLKGSYKGRKSGSKESVVKFLSKPANELALKLLNKGYKIGEVAKLAEIHPNTVAKVKRLGLPTQTKETV